MRSTANKGQTIFEMAKDALGGEKPPPSAAINPAEGLYNPLAMKLGGYVAIDNPRDFKNFFGREFAVGAITQYTRVIGQENHHFTDYRLCAEDGEEVLRIRAMPNPDTSFGCFILTPYKEMGYDAEILKAFEGDEVIDRVDEDDRKTWVPYVRKNSFNNVILTRAEAEGRSNLRLRYWDFVKKKGKDLRLLIVEMNLDTAWFQTFYGLPCDHRDIRVIAGHV